MSKPSAWASAYSLIASLCSFIPSLSVSSLYVSGLLVLSCSRFFTWLFFPDFYFSGVV